MAKQSEALSLQPSRLQKGKILAWLIGVAFSGLLLAIIIQLILQFIVPPPPHRLLLVKDIPLPGALPDAYRTSQNPLAPGVAELFDHFDFQALDPNTHLLFIAHTGPAPDKEQVINPKFNPTTDVKNDGNVIVFDTRQNKIVAVLPLPQVTGVVAAPDLHKVYAANANDNIVYAIDEHTLKARAIQLQNNDSPDGMEYDATDHLIFVSDPGTPANPDQSQDINRKNQNETVINALTDKVITRIPLGIDGKWGDDVGHVRFDPGLHRIFVTVQQLPDPDSPNPNLLPPPGTARLVEIDPTTYKVITRVTLPNTCFTPHGLVIDAQQHIAFIACIDADPPSLVRVDLRTMRVIAEPLWPIPVKPDILVLDRPLHLLYVGAGAGIAIFQENGRSLQWLANYTFGVSTHTIAVNEQTHEIYLPLPRLGGRPVLQIMRYNTNGLL
jgi:hypothetical protein